VLQIVHGVVCIKKEMVCLWVGGGATVITGGGVRRLRHTTLWNVSFLKVYLVNVPCDTQQSFV